MGAEGRASGRAGDGVVSGGGDVGAFGDGEDLAAGLDLQIDDDDDDNDGFGFGGGRSGVVGGVGTGAGSGPLQVDARDPAAISLGDDDDDEDDDDDIFGVQSGGSTVEPKL